jgi:hypothetical protein
MEYLWGEIPLKNSFKVLMLFICLISLANCRRNGPMGGGPMGGAGPCRRCNNLARKPNDEEFRRERNPNFLAPFPNNNPNNLGSLDLGNSFGDFSDPVQPENLGEIGGTGFNTSPANPTQGSHQ